MFTITNYKYGMMDDFKYNGVDKKFNSKIDIPSLIDYYAQNGIVRVGLLDGKPVGAGGVFKRFEGLGDVWLLFNKEARPYIKTVYKELKKVIDYCFNTGYVRLQTSCSLINENIRLLEHLGFRRECLMRKAGTNGEDMYSYALIKED